MKRIALLALALATLACSPLAQTAAPARPACADKVAAAFTSTKPVKGAFACVVGNYGPEFASSGVTSDDSWAAHNKQAGIDRPFVYETRLHDGAFVYRADVKISTGAVVSVYLVMWIAKDGEVYTLDLISVVN